MDNLPELRDIHLPEEGVSIFPLAMGWWGILGTLLIMFLSLKLFLWIRRTSAKIYARHLMKQLQKNDINSAVKMSELLRRICKRKYPEAVAYSGDVWINFLNSHTKYKISDKVADLLKNAPFISETSNLFNENDVLDLRKFCEEWIGENL